MPVDWARRPDVADIRAERISSFRDNFDLLYIVIGFD
jgi:hypothetical protein